MSYSLIEIEALAKRATRGGGFPWGLAEDSAKAVRWLASFGLDGAKLLADLLQQDDDVGLVDVTPITLDGDWNGRAGGLSPIICGPALSDSAARLKDGAITLHNVTHPLLLLPFAALAARRIGAPVVLEWDGVRASSDGNTVSIDGTEGALYTCGGARVTCIVNTEFIGKYQPTIRGQLSDETVEELMVFALRAFAPITAQSRELGAGAGLNDNE